MTPEEFRQAAHRVVDWMADYQERVESLNVLAPVAPGEISRALPSTPPEDPEAFGEIFRSFEEKIIPGMTHWNHPGFFAYFPANNSPPSILAEMIMATLGAQCMSWKTSPAATELEQVVMDWLRQMVGLPESFTGVIQDTASSATLVSLLTAREKWLSRGELARLTVYTSREAHSSVARAAKLAGFSAANLRLVGVDSQYAMRADELAQKIAADRARGLIPCAVVATVGTTSSTAIDPVAAIGEGCRQEGVWLHVDAAYAGTAAICPEHRYLVDGAEFADTFLFNPHKWMFTNFDCTAYFVRDVEALQSTFRYGGDYLKTAEDSEVVNFKDWGIALGRRFRALKLWFVIRSYGVQGLREKIRYHIELAQWLRERLEEDPRFEVVAPSPLGLVCFRLTDPGLTEAEQDRANRVLLARLNATGEVFLTHTNLGGRFTLRASVGQRQTTDRHVQRLWDLLRTCSRPSE